MWVDTDLRLGWLLVCVLVSGHDTVRSICWFLCFSAMPSSGVQIITGSGQYSRQTDWLLLAVTQCYVYSCAYMSTRCCMWVRIVVL